MCLWRFWTYLRKYEKQTTDLVITAKNAVLTRQATDNQQPTKKNEPKLHKILNIPTHPNPRWGNGHTAATI